MQKKKRACTEKPFNIVLHQRPNKYIHMDVNINADIETVYKY